MPVNVAISEFMGRLPGYFENDGCVIDQLFQPRVPEGMIRCYVGGDPSWASAMAHQGIDPAAA
jgi:hypothetical protein